MTVTDVDLINKLDISAAVSEDELRICWIMASRTENKDTLKYRFHTHNFFEAHFVLSGHLIYGFEDETVTLGSGEYLIVSPMLTHKVVSHSEDFVKVTVAFEAENGLYRLLSEKRKKPEAFTDEMSAALDFAGSRARSAKAYSDALIRNRLAELILLIAESTNTVPFKNERKAYDGRVLKAKRLIEDNESIFFTAEEVASYCHLSAKQLGRLFMRYENKTVLCHIHECKISMARHLVSESGDGFEDIGKRLGFSDVSYFNKFFLRHTGLTPGEYRKKSKDKL